MKRFLLILFVLLPMMLSAQNLVPVRHTNGKWGFKESEYSEKFVIKPKFEEAHPFAGDYAFVCKKGLWGIIGKDGKFAIAPKYSSASQPYSGITIVQLGSKYGLVKDCKDILRVEYENIANFGNAYKLKSNGLFGLANANGKIVLETKYKKVLYLQNNTFAVYSNKFEFVNSEGKVVGQPNNVLLYTTNDGDTIDRGGRIGKIVYNTCHNGQGVMIFDRPIAEIGEKAFYDCDGLTSITIPNSVTSIGEYAFAYCDGLTSITIPNSVTSIGERVFCGCSSLASITIPNSVTSIGNRAFYNCGGLTSITLPNCVTSIGEYAFAYCDGLTSITIPDSVTLIGEEGFAGCTGLTRINVNISDLTRYCTSNLMHSIPGEKHLYLNGKEVTNLVIPNCVTTIGDSAFRNCSGLISITIPNSVTSIGKEAFVGCENLLKANFQGTTPPSMGEAVFRKVSGDFKIYLPKGTLDAYESGDWSMDYKFLIVGFRMSKIPANQIITYTTTDGCKISANDDNCAHILSSSNLYLHTYENGVGKLIFEDSVTEIVKQAFYGCENLKSITIPNSVTEIGYRAFENCRSLTSVTIPNSVTKIGYEAFKDCGSLVNITLGSGVTSIGDWAFSGCRHLKEIHFPDLAAWCRVYWDGKNEWEDRETKVFVGGKDIEQIREITIPSGIEHIPDYTFAYFRNLSSITIPNSVTSIGDGAFHYCSSLTSITIPNSVTSIGNGAFYYCSSLTSITLPKSLTLIEDQAFYGCTALKAVYCNPAVPPLLGMWVFDYDGGPICCTIYVPATSRTMYVNAKGWRKYSSFIRAR